MVAGNFGKEDEDEKGGVKMNKTQVVYCILLVLARGEAYVAEILERFKQANDCKMTEGTLYPMLARLERDGALEYRWEESKTGPPRKYYAITEYGKLVLGRINGEWDEWMEQMKLLRFGAPQTAAGKAMQAVRARRKTIMKIFN